MDQVGKSIGIQTNTTSLLLDEIGNLKQGYQPQRWLTKTTENYPGKMAEMISSNPGRWLNVRSYS